MEGTILVVQSSPTYSETNIVDELEACGFSVLTAEDPHLALYELQHTVVDYVVVDSVTPTLEEPQMQKFLTELGDKHSSPPLIVVSSSPHAPSFSAKWGAAAFLPKPCPSAELKPFFARMTEKKNPKIGKSRSIF